MIVAELRIVPVGAGSSMEEPLEKVVEALERSGVKYQVGPIGTVLEGRDVDEVLDAAKSAHEALAKGRAVPRIVTTITIDHRLDKDETVESLSTIRH